MVDRITYKVHDINIPQADNPAKTVSKNVFLAEDTHSEGGMLGFLGPDSTLVSNVLTPVDTVVVVRGEGAAPDIIDHISYSSEPQIKDKDLVWLIQGAEQITINHNTAAPPANTGPVLLLSKANKKMVGTRMVLLQRQGNNFQEIAFDGIVGNNGILVEDDSGKAIIVCGSVAIAVNHLKITNAATGNDVIIEAIGSDTNVGIVLTPKGTGEIIGAMETMMIPLGDQSTVNTVGIKDGFDLPNNIKIVSVYQSSYVAPTTAALTLDILDEGASIFSVKPTIAAGANNGENGVLNTAPHVMSKGDKIEFSVVTLDTGLTSAGTKLFVRFYRTS